MKICVSSWHSGFHNFCIYSLQFSLGDIAIAGSALMCGRVTEQVINQFTGFADKYTASDKCFSSHYCFLYSLQNYSLSLSLSLSLTHTHTHTLLEGVCFVIAPLFQADFHRFKFGLPRVNFTNLPCAL